jgi:polar amino acid transport system substrate-binding protein
MTIEGGFAVKNGLLRRFLLVSLVALLVAALFAGCGSKSVLSQIKKDKKLIVGTEATFPPFESVDENNKIVGFDIALAGEIAKDLGVTLEVQDMKFDTLVPALQTGKIHLAAAAMSIKPDKAQQVDFSKPYYQAAQSIVILSGNTKITKADDLKTAKVAVQTGTTGDQLVTETYGTAKIERIDRFTDAFLMLDQGKVDAVVLDTPVAKAYVAASGAKMQILGDPMGAEEYGLAMPKGNTDYVDAVNKSLDRMKADGTFDRLVQEWFK